MYLYTNASNFACMMQDKSIPRFYCLQCYPVTLLAKPGRFNEHMKYIFAVGVGGVEENCKENNYSPQTYCAQVQCHLVLYHNFFQGLV